MVTTRSQAGGVKEKKESKDNNYNVWLKKSEGLLPFRDTLGPLLLVGLMPPFMVIERMFAA